MLNRIESYSECGQKASVARIRKDEACAQHWSDHYRKLLALESQDDKVAAAKAFNDAYRLESEARFASLKGTWVV